MNPVQHAIAILFFLTGLGVFIKGYQQAIRHKNSFGETPFLFWLGIFVWGDAIIFGPFWMIVTGIVFWLQNWLLFLLFISSFWLIRSMGESIYWFNQQFSSLNRNPPANLRGYHLFQNDAIWFVYQIFWQSVTCFSLVATLFLASRWFH